MLGLLETLIFLFGTAFIFGFVTYGLKKDLNAEKPAAPTSEVPQPEVPRIEVPKDAMPQPTVPQPIVPPVEAAPAESVVKTPPESPTTGTSNIAN